MTSTTITTKTHATREEWLAAATEQFRPLIGQFATVPANVRVSCGLPSRGAFGAKKRTIGECWSPKNSADKVTEVFVSPTIDDPHEVLGTLAHELVHAAVGVEAGHKAPFARVAKAIGLTGKMTATVVGDELRVKQEAMLGILGAYPHGRLDYSKRKKQGTRMLKVACPSCGYQIRTTQKWIDVGLPTCVCGTPMTRDGAAPEDGGEGEGETILDGAGFLAPIGE